MQICSAYNSYGCSELASGYRDVLYEASALGYHRTGEGHTLDLDSKWIGSRLSVEPEAARPAGPEIPHPSQGFLNGVLALSSLPPLGRAPGCKVVAREPLADTGEQAVPPLGLWTK